MLQKSERFQNDVKIYQASIDKMEDGIEKLEAKRLLNDLIYEVKNMDGMFMDMVYSKQLPSMGTEMREKIVSIRQKLDNKIKNATKI